MHLSNACKRIYIRAVERNTLHRYRYRRRLLTLIRIIHTTRGEVVRQRVYGTAEHESIRQAGEMIARIFYKINKNSCRALKNEREIRSFARSRDGSRVVGYGVTFDTLYYASNAVYRFIRVLDKFSVLLRCSGIMARHFVAALLFYDQHIHRERKKSYI